MSSAGLRIGFGIYFDKVENGIVGLIDNLKKL